MKLSEAILLGDTLKKCDSTRWLSPDGSCGCAFGGALLAVGAYSKDLAVALRDMRVEAIAEIPLIRAQWPWLEASHLTTISGKYFGVADGLNTIEDVAAYVRAIEPSEETEVYQGDAGDETEPKCQVCRVPLYLHNEPCEQDFSDDAMVSRERERGL